MCSRRPLLVILDIQTSADSLIILQVLFSFMALSIRYCCYTLSTSAPSARRKTKMCVDTSVLILDFPLLPMDAKICLGAPADFYLRIKILLLSSTPAEVWCDVTAGGTPRRQTVTVQRPAEQSFSQQFVRPQQMLEGKVKFSTETRYHLYTVFCFILSFLFNSFKTGALEQNFETLNWSMIIRKNVQNPQKHFKSHHCKQTTNDAVQRVKKN